MNDTTFQGDGKIAYVPVVVNAKPPKQSNYDRLISKSPEELAEFMCHNVSNGTVNCAFCAAAEFCRMGHNGWIDWMKQEVTDG